MSENSYNIWFKIYKNLFYNIYVYVLALRFLNKYYLLNENNKLETLDELEFSFNGFIEKDIKYLISENKHKKEIVQLKILFTILSGISLYKYKQYFKQDFDIIIEDLLINLPMEQMGIKYEKIANMLFKQNILSMDDVMVISIKRGALNKSDKIINGVNYNLLKFIAKQ